MAHTFTGRALSNENEVCLGCRINLIKFVDYLLDGGALARFHIPTLLKERPSSVGLRGILFEIRIACAVGYFPCCDMPANFMIPDELMIWLQSGVKLEGSHSPERETRSKCVNDSIHMTYHDHISDEGSIRKPARASTSSGAWASDLSMIFIVFNSKIHLPSIGVHYLRQ